MRIPLIFFSTILLVICHASHVKFSMTLIVEYFRKYYENIGKTCKKWTCSGVATNGR